MKIKLYLKELRGTNYYKVTKIVNSIRWNVGEKLSKEEVAIILRNYNTNPIDVDIS